MLNILLMCNKPSIGNDANTIIDHIEAIENYSNHKIWLLSNMGDLTQNFDFNKFDVVIIHYSLCILNNSYLSLDVKNRLRAYKGLKVIFVQDEYRQINLMIDQLQYLDVDVLFTCFPAAEMGKIYTEEALPKLSKYSNLTGYIPPRLLEIRNQPKTSERPLHVGYRGRCPPYHLGELSFEKWNIVDKWHQQVNDVNIKTNISYNEHERIYGHQWIDFVSSCKATLGVESGASVMDFTGKLETLVNFHRSNFPHDSFREIQRIYLKDHEGKYKLNQISPRCFEAIALKTVLILYEGEYSGILMPNRHYIELKKDFSNIQDVLSKLKDDDYLQAMADSTYQEIALNPEYNYQTFVQHIDHLIDLEFESRLKKKVNDLYTVDDFHKIISQEDLYSSGSSKTKKTQLIVIKLNTWLKEKPLFNKIKFFITRRIRLFNPFLRHIKNKILQFCF